MQKEKHGKKKQIIVIAPRRARDFAKQGKVIVVVGPTASGKSDLAIKIARRIGGEIISADSRQVYKGMDIGTGKVTKKEQRLIPHHLLDVADPKRQFTVSRYKKLAQAKIKDIVRRGKTPIIVGGTGLYVDALVYDLKFPEIKQNLILRAKLEKKSPEELYSRLKALDPRRSTTIDRHNKRRLIRALEIIITTGKPVSQTPYPNVLLYNDRSIVEQIPYEVFWLGIHPDKSARGAAPAGGQGPASGGKLAQRIKKRLDKRLKHGMIQEVAKLHKSGLSWKRLESFGLEYKWIALFLQNKIVRQQMYDVLLRDIIRYSKRQMTWFKRNKNIQWIQSFGEAIKLVRSSLEL